MAFRKQEIPRCVLARRGILVSILLFPLLATDIVVDSRELE